MKHHVYAFPCLVLAALLAGCDTGTLTVELTDAPADDVSSVVIAIRGVDAESADGSRERFDFEPPVEVDLARLVDGNRLTLLDEVTVDADDYRAIVLRLDTERRARTPLATRLDGRVQRLRTLPEEVSARRDFKVDELGSERILLDLDLRSSLREDDDDIADDRLRLVPQLRAVRSDRVGTILGIVGPAITGRAGCVPAVYVYEGRDAELTTLSDEDPPLATTLARADLNGIVRYRLEALEEGDYRLAVTCDALRDDPEDPDGEVDFLDAVSIALRRQQLREQNFPQ